MAYEAQISQIGAQRPAGGQYQDMRNALRLLTGWEWRGPS
jgi:hypothetical protein